MLVGAWEVEGRGEGMRGGCVGPGLLGSILRSERARMEAFL